MAKPKTEEEGRLYEPVRDYLQKQFGAFGECELEVTRERITEKVKRWLDDPSLFFIRVEKKLPDVMGHFKPDPSKQPPHGFYEGLIVTEIKSEPPKVQDIFQTKLYAEVFEAPFAYLISSKGMVEEMRRFLSKRYSLLSYGAYRKVYIGKFNLIELQIREEDWYPENPFKRSS
jgi:hypothetical protein